MRVRFVLPTLMMLSGSAFAQQFEWAIIHPLDLSTSISAVRYPLTLDTADNPIYGRLARSILSPYGEHVIEKLDRMGTSLFSDTLFGKVLLQHLVIDRNNNIVGAGLFRDTMRVDTAVLTTPSGTTIHCFLLKLDHLGRLLWLRNMTQVDPAYKEIFSLKADADNNLWAAVSPGFPTSYVKKLDGDGNEVVSFQQTNARVISGLAIDDEGNVWATGSTFDGSHSFNGLQVTAPYQYNMYVVRYSPTGTASWVRFVQDITLSHPMLAPAGRGVVMGGRLIAATMFGTIPAHGPHWVYDLYATMIDSGGLFTWLSEVPTGGGDAGPGESSFISTAADGSTIVTGFTRGTVNWGNGVVTQAPLTGEVLVLAHSSNGTVQWAKNVGGQYYNRGDAIAVDRDGGIYVTGMVGLNPRFDSLQFTGSTINSFIAKIRPDRPASVADNTQPNSFALHQNYPNPFNLRTHIGFEVGGSGVSSPEGYGPQAGFVSLKVYDMLGREVATLVNEEKPPGAYEVTWNAEGLASAVYLYRLSTNGFTATRKLMLLR